LEYDQFVKCAQVVKEFNEEIITIAGNIGCLFEGTEKFVDYVCRPEVDENGNIDTLLYCILEFLY